MKENRALYVVLGILSYKPMSGYEVRKHAAKWISYFWDIGYRQIYPALKELNSRGLVKVSGAGAGKRPESKIYTLTPQGRRELVKWLKNPRLDEVYRSELLLKLFFGALIEPEYNAAKVMALKEKADRESKTLDSVVSKLSGVPGEAYPMFTAMFGARYYKMCSDWSAEVVEILRKMENGRKKNAGKKVSK